MLESNTHLLVFSIGPVQGFISASRRGRDLWFSSWLLSEIARAAGKAVKQHLVMPTAERIDETASAVSNKLLLVLQGNEPASIAKMMEDAARARLREIREDLLRDIDTDLIDTDRAAAQIDDLPEFIWASADIRDGRDYGQARQLAEALLAARKSCKTFRQPSWAKDVPKSSLDAERETVIKADASNRQRRLHKLGIGPSEHLCGVGLLKRRGFRITDQEGGKVQSTSHVASWSLRRHFEEPSSFQERCREAFLAYETALRELDADLSKTPIKDPVLGWRDGHILYESRLRDLFPKDAPEVNDAKRALRRLFSAWKAAARDAKIELPALTPYYVVLLADGDHMGKALDEIRSREPHGRVTDALEAFAQDAREIVDTHHGHCIYSGGDDVLALLPVIEAVRCASALNDRFQTVSDTFIKVGSKTRPSLSAGLCVAHHVSPLGDALDGARKAEKHAKQALGRDAWAIYVDKRSGAPTLTGGKWSELPCLVKAIDAMSRLDLTRGLPHEILALARRLPGDGLAPVRRAELYRVLAQKDLEPKMFDDQLDESVDLEMLATRLVAARALSGMEADRGE